MGKHIGKYGYYDEIIKLCKGPRKLSYRAVAEMLGISVNTVRRVLIAYSCVANDNVEKLENMLRRKDMSLGMANWAFDYFGKPIPNDLLKENEDVRQVTKIEDVDVDKLVKYVEALGDAVFAEMRTQTVLLQQLLRIWEVG